MTDSELLNKLEEIIATGWHIEVERQKTWNRKTNNYDWGDVFSTHEAGAFIGGGQSYGSSLRESLIKFVEAAVPGDAPIPMIPDDYVGFLI